MAFGPETYSRSAPTRYAEIEWGWYYHGEDQVTIYWDTDVYFGSVYLYNPYRSFTSGDTFPGSDGNNYQIGTYQEQDGPYYYPTPTSGSTTYAAGYEYYSIKQEVVNSAIPLGITSGAISLGDLRTFFLGTSSGAISLSDLYRGGAYVPDIPENSAVPTSGEIKLSDFYGSHK